MDFIPDAGEVYVACNSRGTSQVILVNHVSEQTKATELMVTNARSRSSKHELIVAEIKMILNFIVMELHLSAMAVKCKRKLIIQYYHLNVVKKNHRCQQGNNCIMLAFLYL